jgi:hypothetical protein
MTTKATQRKQARVYTPEEWAAHRQPLPKSWKRAAGMLKGRKIDPVKYQREIRAEWEKRLRRQYQLAGIKLPHDR